MRRSKIDSDKRRLQYKEFALKAKSLGTVRGYISALDSHYLIGDVCEELFQTRDIFDITDMDDLNKVRLSILKSERNKLSHSRYSAALNSYLQFVNN